MKKLQVWTWLISGFLKKHKKIILLSTSLGIFLAFFVIWVLPFIPRPNPVRKIGVIGQYTQDNLPTNIASQVGQGLTFIVEDGSPAPALAEDWSISNDNRTYTFFLRSDLYWQDEKKLKAQDISYNFSDVEVKYLDDKTIQFILKEPYTPFPLLLSKPIFKDKIIGTGKYKIRKLEEKSGHLTKLTLESKDETIKYQFYPNLETAKIAFKLGEIRSIENVYTDPFADNLDWENYIQLSTQISYDQYIALFLNNKDGLLQSKAFRQALSYATKKPTDSSRALGPICPKSWCYAQDELKTYDYDPQRSRQLLEKDLGNLDKTSEITLKISTPQTFLETAEQIKKSWEEALGIKVEIQVINTIPNDFQILLVSQQIPPDPDQYALWHSTENQSLTGFSTPRIDKLLEDGRQETDPDKRAEIYSEFQKFFLEESPVIFIKYPTIYTIEKKSLIQKFLHQFLLDSPKHQYD